MTARDVPDGLCGVAEGLDRECPTAAFGMGLAGPSVVVGELLGLSDHGGLALVQPLGAATLSTARSTVALDARHIGAQVVMVFEQNAATAPIVIGVLQGDPRAASVPAPVPVEVEFDGRRLVIVAREQLVLRCGEASITLTRAGKVLIEGTYVSSKASGVHRIKGGTVQIN